MYARFAKTFALDALATGGLYIAGGIAAHNVPLFESETFINEFLSCGKQKVLLSMIPIYVIADYNVSLYGAAEFMRLEDFCMKSSHLEIIRVRNGKHAFLDLCQSTPIQFIW